MGKTGKVILKLFGRTLIIAQALLNMMNAILWLIRNTYIQMTKIYFSYVFHLHPQFLAYTSQNPWNFLSVDSDKCVSCYVNEVTFGPHLKMGLVARRTNHEIRVEHSVPPPDLQGGEGDGGWIKCQWPVINWSWLCNEASIKTQKDGVWRTSGLVHT